MFPLYYKLNCEYCPLIYICVITYSYLIVEEQLISKGSFLRITNPNYDMTYIYIILLPKLLYSICSDPATGRGKSNRPIDLAATDLEDKLQWIKNNEHRLVWETEKVRDEKMKRVIDEYFTSLETDLADLDLDEMKKNVEEFYDDGLLSSEAYKHAYKKYVDLKNASAPVMKKDTNGCKKEEVLFSKENVYLSLICCKALDSSQNISTFLKTDSNCCRHKFERVSKSRGESSLLIAKKRESSVYFVACRVQSHWNES